MGSSGSSPTFIPSRLHNRAAFYRPSVWEGRQCGVTLAIEANAATDNPLVLEDAVV